MATPKQSEHRRLSAAQNLTNAVLMVAVAIPSVYYAWYLSNVCMPQQQKAVVALEELWHYKSWSATASCAVGYQHPMVTVNILFFLNVNCLFWIISLVQGSTWLIGAVQLQAFAVRCGKIYFM